MPNYPVNNQTHHQDLMMENEFYELDIDPIDELMQDEWMDESSFSLPTIKTNSKGEIDASAAFIALGILGTASPSLAIALASLSVGANVANVTLGVGISVGGSAVAGRGFGSNASVGIVALPRPGAFGVYGAAGWQDIIGTPGVGAALTLQVQCVKGDEKNFSGRSYSLGGSITVPPFYTGSLSFIHDVNTGLPFGVAGEFGGTLSTEDITAGGELFIEQTRTIVLSDRGVSKEFQSETGLPNSVEQAVAMLRQQGHSKREIKNAMRELGFR